jgi:linoleate 8R-lipoxygenase / 9,12-octadecadienoate 8-hydroperoxide 8R-isomerase
VISPVSFLIIRITCGLYINIILNDFVSTLAGIPELNTAWLLDPSVGEATENFGAEWTPSSGNQVSCEFSLLSQCHMLISDRDDKWMQAFLRKILPGIDPATASSEDFQRGLLGYLHSLESDPSKRQCGDLKRSSDGTFDNAALLKVLSESTEDCAGTLMNSGRLTVGAFNSGIPKVLKGFVLLGIKQSRLWRTATLNEFRTFFKLSEHKTFDDITSNPQTAEMLSRFYGHPNNVEFYPGVLVENATALPPPTLGRGLFSDAISVLRGDRFYTQASSFNILVNIRTILLLI